MLNIEIKDDLSNLPKELLVSLIGSLITNAEDIAFAYDINDEMIERISNALTEHEIDYIITEDDDI